MFECLTEAEEESPFCKPCARRWQEAYELCNFYAGVNNTINKDSRFNNNADTYTKQASMAVQECLAEVVTRIPTQEESIDKFRRKQYHKLRKFDPTKVDNTD